jgi:hypothetical protein
VAKNIAAALVCALVLSASALAEDVVFKNVPDKGFFTPYDSSTPAGTLYGDGGWLSANIPDTFTLTRIELGLATFGGTAGGTTDLTFTFNDGDPSGLVFGSGATLYSTTVKDVTLPVSGDPGLAEYFTVSIDLPSIETFGGFNNIGFSVGVENYSFDGEFGFQVSSPAGQQVGFYTNNASTFDGSNWSLFSFGSGSAGVANLVATIYTPEPTSLLGLIAAGLLVIRRR